MSLPTIHVGDRELLCKVISKDEIQEMIQTLKDGKPPGHDGFGPEFYRNGQGFITEPLLKMYTDYFARCELPPTLSHANIDEDCSNYRLVSLISVDSKILARGLERFLQT
uniref:Uncharacterized protein n=1 Tax=Oncorhynchus kisutch TaxID=8019 RepID=A0A8C7HD43_ONCKI